MKSLGTFIKQSLELRTGGTWFHLFYCVLNWFICCALYVYILLTIQCSHWPWLWWKLCLIKLYYLKSWSDLRVFSNPCPFQILRSMADLLVRVMAYVSEIIERRFEKVRSAIDSRIGHIWEFEKGHRSDSLKKSEVQVSVMYKSDMDLLIGCQLEAGRRSESYYII